METLQKKNNVLKQIILDYNSKNLAKIKEDPNLHSSQRITGKTDLG